MAKIFIKYFTKKGEIVIATCNKLNEIAINMHIKNKHVFTSDIVSFNMTVIIHHIYMFFVIGVRAHGMLGLPSWLRRCQMLSFILRHVRFQQPTSQEHE